MTNSNYEVRIVGEDDEISFQQTSSQIARFRLRGDSSTTVIDYDDGERALAACNILEVLAPAPGILSIMLDWGDYPHGPTFRQFPLPEVTRESLPTNNPTMSRVSFPIPTLLHSWYIWREIGGHTPGFNLKVMVKRK